MIDEPVILASHIHATSTTFYPLISCGEFFLIERPPGYEYLVGIMNKTHYLYLPWQYYLYGEDRRYRQGSLCAIFGSPVQRTKPDDPVYYLPLPAVRADNTTCVHEFSKRHTEFAHRFNNAVEIFFYARSVREYFRPSRELLRSVGLDAISGADAFRDRWEALSPEEVLALPWHQTSLTLLHQYFPDCTNYTRIPLSEATVTKE